MENKDIANRRLELEREISCLPIGSLTKKRIKDKEYYYHRIVQNGKRIENYISFDQVSDLEIKLIDVRN